MSRRRKQKRPLQAYFDAARSLVEHNKEQYRKYLYKTDLTAQEKAAISRAKKWGEKRLSDSELIRYAHQLDKYAPVLKQFRKRSETKPKKLLPKERGIITRKVRLLRYAKDLVPVSKKAAKKLHSKLVGPGIHAIQFNNTSPTAKVHYVNDELTLTSNGRDWLYWEIENADPQLMKQAARDAFTNVRDAFPIEKITTLVKRAFKRPTTREVYLWTAQGRVGQGFKSLKQFLRWFNREYHGYESPEKWINGIALRLGEAPNRPQKTDDDYEDNDDDDFNENELDDE